MIYADWYFCYQTKLSPQDTDEYLNLMFALENEHVPMDTKVDALNRLIRFDVLFQYYAVPVLVDSLLTPHGRECLAVETDIKNKELYVETIKNIFRNMIRKEDAFNYSVSGLDVDDYDKIIAPRPCRKPTPTWNQNGILIIWRQICLGRKYCICPFSGQWQKLYRSR